MKRLLFAFLAVGVILLISCTAPTVTQTVNVTTTKTPTTTPTVTITSTAFSTVTVTSTATQTVTTTQPATTTTLPTTTTTPATITPAGDDVVVLSSNVFTTVSSTFLIDGEDRRLNMVAELRNDSSVDMELDEVFFYFYDTSGGVVCKRWTYAYDDVLPPGGITVARETVPSQMYWNNETNDFPEDWANYEVAVSAEPYQPAEGEAGPIEVTVQNVAVTVTSSGGLEVTGSMLNTGQKTATDITPYAILYDSGGEILNADNGYISDDLQPGQSLDFEISFSYNEPIDYDHYIVKAYAEG
jgi:hypothetical protein